MRRYGLWAAWAVVITAWAAMCVVLLVRVPSGGSDFSIFLAAGEALRFNSHADIYQLNVLRAALHLHGGCNSLGTGCATACNIWGLPYVYQPLLALLLVPLSALSCADAWFGWQLLNVVLWAACTVVLIWPELSRHPWRALVITALCVTFLPLLQGLLIGQVNIIVLASCLIGSALVQRRHPYAAGAVLAFGAILKYFPAFLIVYYVLARQWRVAAGAIVAGGALTIVELVVVGPETVLSSFGASAAETQAQSHGLWVTAIPGGALWAVVAAAGFVAGMLWAAREGKGDERLGLSWALCTMLLVSPFVHWLYLTWVLPAFVASYSVALDGFHRPLRWQQWTPLALLAVAYALVLVRMVANTYMDQSGVIATLILWVLCGAFYLRSAGATLPFARPLSGRLLLTEESAS